MDELRAAPDFNEPLVDLRDNREAPRYDAHRAPRTSADCASTTRCSFSPMIVDEQRLVTWLPADEATATRTRPHRRHGCSYESRAAPRHRLKGRDEQATARDCWGGA